MANPTAPDLAQSCYAKIYKTWKWHSTEKTVAMYISKVWGYFYGQGHLMNIYSISNSDCRILRQLENKGIWRYFRDSGPMATTTVGILKSRFG